MIKSNTIKTADNKTVSQVVGAIVKNDWNAVRWFLDISSQLIGMDPDHVEVWQVRWYPYD